ncbi:MAG: sigma-54 dependent transcriptional regulator [bacterium]
MDNILIIEDHQNTRQGLTSLLRNSGYQVDEACNGFEAEAMITGTPYDLVLVDLLLPYMNGLEILKKVKEISPNTEVIVITGNESIDSAINSMKLGAYDYLLKPFEPQKIIDTVHHAIERKNFMTRPPCEPLSGTPSLVGRSRQMVEIFKLLARISDVESPILIVGEDGTGKKTLAQTIHQNSPWRAFPFISLNCSTIPGNLSEEQTFRYLKEKVQEETEKVNGEKVSCTLYLRNIDKATPSVQSSLLFFLDAASRADDDQDMQLSANIRLIASIKKNIKGMIECKSFRQDLFFRINGLPIYLPPLRERKVDIPLLANHFLSRYAISPMKSLCPDVLSRFTRYNWPGNVQEIKNVIEYAVLMSSQSQITLEDLPSYLREIDSPFPQAVQEKDLTLKELEKLYILKKLEVNCWDQKKTARNLGIGRTTLWRRLKEYGTDVPSLRKAVD